MTSARASSAGSARPRHEPVTVRWFSVGTGADTALRAHVAEVGGIDPEVVRVGRLCGRCGSTSHGRPWASAGLEVSVARSGPYLVTAVSTAGPVGVDVERVDAVDRGWGDLSTVLEPTPVPEGTGRAALWCRTEAVLKREGTGFAAPPSGDVLERGVVDDLVAPDGYCAAVAYDVP